MSFVETWGKIDILGGTDVPFDGILCDFFILREDGES